MVHTRSIAITGCLLALLVSSPGCLVRRRIISRSSSPSAHPKPLLTASRDDLVRRLQNQYNEIRSFNATVDMTPATGSVYKGEITEYKDIRAYVLYRKPEDIRIIGLAPVVRTTVFDMVSTGQEFHILIPPKNRFVEGRNDAPRNSKNSLENLRPEAFLQAMLIPPPDLSKETPLLVDSTDELSALYVLVLVGRAANGDLAINRTVFFDRTTLTVVRQRAYDKENILSDTRYSGWKMFGGVPFPMTIDISRPTDGYGVSMSVVKLEMNPSIADDKFVLARPEGAQLQVIGQSNSPGTPAK